MVQALSTCKAAPRCQESGRVTNGCSTVCSSRRPMAPRGLPYRRYRFKLRTEVNHRFRLKRRSLRVKPRSEFQALKARPIPAQGVALGMDALRIMSAESATYRKISMRCDGGTESYRSRLQIGMRRLASRES